MPSSRFLAYQDSSVVRKAEGFAKYTIPSLMADASRYGNAEVFEADFQSVGALLVNNLTAKLASALFPAGRPFHKIKIDKELRAKAVAAGVDESALATGAAEMERLSTEQLFKNAALSRLHRVLKLAIVTGDCLLYRDIDRQKFLVWNLQSYAVRRNTFGEVEEIILRQRVRFDTLPLEIQQVYASDKRVQQDEIVDLYTEVIYDRQASNRVYVQQTIEDKPVGEVAEYPEHLCPYIVVAWNVPDGEHYGRGYVEEYAGDFTKLSLMSEQLGLYELESLQLLNVVDEAAGGVIDDYQEADIGDYVPGKVNAVTAYERGDYNKMVAVRNGLNEIAMRLSQAFMYTGNQRDAERVTAEEIRTIAQEAENLLGGTYSILAETLQAPLAYLCMYEVALGTEDTDIIYEVVAKQYMPEIVTGIPALTQATETQNLMRATGELSQIIPVLAQLSLRFDPEKIIEMVMHNNSVALDAISKPPEQIAKEAEQQRVQQEQAIDGAQEQALEEGM